MLALGPLFAVVGGSIMLELAVPILAALVAVPGQIDQQAAMGFFVVGFVHVVLMLMALLVSAVMVAKWEVFGFARPEKALENAPEAPVMAPAQTAAPVQSRAAQVAPTASANAAAQRRIDVNVPSTMAANDTGASGTTSVRETKVFATTSGGGQSSTGGAQTSRTRGIGNRFRSAGANNATPKPERHK